MIFSSRLEFVQSGRTLLFIAVGAARPIITSTAWLFITLLIGALPPILGYIVGSTFHQPLTGILLAPLFWGCVCEDRVIRALLVLALALGAHSAVAIYLSITDPPGAAATLSGSQAYWEQARQWIRTGSDSDYQLANWLPQHLLLFVMVLLAGALSFGVLPFAVGVQQVDLMNYYVGRMVAQSDHPALTLLLGWHFWSLLRGIGYAVLLFVTAGWMIELLTGRRASTRRSHCYRLVIAVMFLVGDGFAKLFFSSVIREQLISTTWPSVQ